MKLIKTLIFCAVTILIISLNPRSVSAEDSKLIDVDLDVDSTVIVKADADVAGLYYLIDKTACLCFAEVEGKDAKGTTTVPCENLKKHKLLSKHLSEC